MEKDTASFWAGMKTYEDILAADPAALSFAPLAEIYRKLGLHDQALEIARKGVARHPEFAAGQMALATVCLDRSLEGEAQQALEAVARITPENLEAQKLLLDLYRAAGNSAGEQRCLQVLAWLDADFAAVASEDAGTAAEPGVPPAPAVIPPEVPLMAAADEVEEIPEEDILELTDDLIEHDILGDEPFAPFAAAPPRPSLEGERRDSAPLQADVAAEPAVSVTEEVAQPPVLTATVAELYISQGLPDKGADVYRELLRSQPDNAVYRERLAELTGEVTVTAPAKGEEGLVATLEGWLDNIRRARECHSETH